MNHEKHDVLKTIVEAGTQKNSVPMCTFDLQKLKYVFEKKLVYQYCNLLLLLVVM